MDIIEKLMDELDVSFELMLKELKKINQKNDLTPMELESIKHIECAVKDHLINCAMLEESEKNDWDNYSEMGPNMSRERGRSPRTGRYISRGMRAGNYSTHSIDDRIVASLEGMMASAKDDYEKQRIEEWMRKVRSEEMTM